MPGNGYCRRVDCDACHVRRERRASPTAPRCWEGRAAQTAVVIQAVRPVCTAAELEQWLSGAVTVQRTVE